MAVYWLSFRLETNSTYSERYDDLTKTIDINSSKWWYGTSSFFVFESVASIDEMVVVVKNAVDERVDLVLMGMPEFKSARIIGVNDDQDIFALMPFTKKA